RIFFLLVCFFALGVNRPSPRPVYARGEELEPSMPPTCETLVPYAYDSGAIGGDATNLTIVSHSNATWIQLDLSLTRLASNARLIVRGDTATQVLDSHALSYASNGYSAVFFGDSVTVSVGLVVPTAASSSSSSRVVVSNVLVGGQCEDDAGVGIQTICGTDDRVPSYDVRQGRIVLNGSCTAWLVSESVFVTAGHCGIPKAASRMYFTYGPRGEVVPPEKQYAVEMSTYKRVYGNGRDWAAGRLMPNAITGWLAGMAQGDWYAIDTNAPIVDTDIRITGYGTDDDPTRNLMQQTHVRRVSQVTSTSVQYNADTMPGNSGGPVLNENTNKVVAIHTNGGCTSSGGSNIGKLFYNDVMSHINYLKSLPRPTFGPTTRPTSRPTRRPSTSKPTSGSPTSRPSTYKPTSKMPSARPTNSPSTSQPTSARPTNKPSTTPQASSNQTQPPILPPTTIPTTAKPTSTRPTTDNPSTRIPSGRPTSTPTSNGPTTDNPSTRIPSGRPTSTPTSNRPTTDNPSTRIPSGRPTSTPTLTPSNRPTTSRPTFVLSTPTCTVESPTSRSCVMRNGVMFDVLAKTTAISITSIAINVNNGTIVQVWTKTGTSVGFEADMSYWTKIKEFNFSGTGMITIPLSQTVTITAGQRRAFYVTMAAGNAYVIYGKNRTTDTASTIIVQDTYLLVDAGSAVKYPFGSDFVSPRFFVGRIAYMTN
ncbi:hypothetical protein ACHAXA_011484, partial [Cyclostephanos tholiformis]